MPWHDSGGMTIVRMQKAAGVLASNHAHDRQSILSRMKDPNDQEGASLEESTLTSRKRNQVKAKSKRIPFTSGRHEEKEIVVPFDDSHFADRLVDEKTWAAAYVSNRQPASFESQRLESKHNAGRLRLSPEWQETSASSAGIILRAIEMILVAWTITRLYFLLPSPAWATFGLIGAWTTSLWLLWSLRQTGSAARMLLWSSAVLATLAWIYPNAFSTVSDYFFRT